MNGWRFTRRAGLYSILLVTGLAVLGLIAAYDGTLLPNDTAQYLSVARHLVNGEGLKTDLIFFSEHLALGKVPVDQTVFPPGYPWLIGLAASLGVSVPDAAFIVNLLAFAAVPVVLYLLGLGMGQPPGWALTGALIWTGLVDNWFITLERQSEIPFTFSTLLALALLPRGDADRSLRPWLAGLAAAVSVTIRYAGIFFVLAAALVLSVRWIRLRSKTSTYQLAAFLAAPTVTILWLFWRNFQLVGDFKGGNAYQEMKPVGLVVLKFYKSLCHILGFTGNGLRALRAGELLLVASILATVLALVWYRRSIRRAVSPSHVGFLELRFLIAILYVGLSVSLLFYMELTTSLEFQPRMVLVLAPFFLAALDQVLSNFTISPGRARRTLFLLGILLLLTFVAGQRNVMQQMRARPNLFALVDEALAAQLADTSVKQHLEREISTHHPLLGNEPQMLGAVLERPVIGLEPPYYTDRDWTPDEVYELVERYGIEHVVLMPEILQISSERPAFFVRLAQEDVPEWLEPIITGPALWVFRVEKDGV